jgi:hypothetical protein
MVIIIIIRMVEDYDFVDVTIIYLIFCNNISIKYLEK